MSELYITNKKQDEFKTSYFLKEPLADAVNKSSNIVIIHSCQVVNS